MLQPPKLGGLHVAFAQRYGQLGRPIPVFRRVLTPFLRAGSLYGLLVRPMSGIQQWMCLNDSRDQHTCRPVLWRVSMWKRAHAWGRLLRFTRRGW